MQLKNLVIKNFRTIESLGFEFPVYYTAISGRNNSGKSNILRVLKALFQPDSRFGFRRDKELSFTENFPIWKTGTGESISFRCDLLLDRFRDSSVFKLATDFFSLSEEITEIMLTVTAEYLKDKDQPELIVEREGIPLDSYKSRTMLKTIKSSGAFQFHNSTEADYPFNTREVFVDLVGEIDQIDRGKLVKDQDRLSKTVASVAKRHQRGISQMLGRLEDKYLVALSAPKLNVDLLPINIALGEKNRGVSLDEWESGTQNKTYILMLMLRAKKLSESPDDNRKIAPILVIEEPENFLHPSAQAEFGRLLQEVSEELQIQLIVATHNPYFLSQQRPQSNILLRRGVHNGRLTATEHVEVGEGNWMEPFALNLGLANPEFEPWKDLFFAKTDRLLLVEGKIDQKYFEMLRSEEHGANRLNFEGEIFSYDGKGNISNGVLLKFLKGRYSRFFLTYDLDAEGSLTKQLTSLDLEKNKHYCPIGRSGAGNDLIEGLLPDRVKATLYGANSGLVSKAISSNKDESKSAKNELKRLQFEEFQRICKPGQEFFGEFYKLVKIINKAMS